MNLQERKSLLMQLGQFMLSGDEDWATTSQKATEKNPWFISEFIKLSAQSIATNFLTDEALTKVITRYNIPEQNDTPKKIGLVMAGNIPMVGFHDLLCTFLTGHYAWCKLSSKDDVLIKKLIEKMAAWKAEAVSYFQISERLKGCDAYIATGSNNSSTYFEYYFSKYPHIIRKSRTSVAVLSGEETEDDLNKLADDVYRYFGLGCRNVTQLYVPRNYNFEPLLTVFKKYNYLSHHNKYKNNYDYNLAIHLLNHTYYMSNESILLIENESPFSPISQINYAFYDDINSVILALKNDDRIQCIVTPRLTNFGQAQQPDICTYADGVDTIAFLTSVNRSTKTLVKDC